MMTSVNCKLTIEEYEFTYVHWNLDNSKHMTYHSFHIDLSFNSNILTVDSEMRLLKINSTIYSSTQQFISIHIETRENLEQFISITLEHMSAIKIK